MATILSGLVDTEDILADERVVDMSERIYKLQPDDQQFMTMLNKVGRKQATREKINWLEDEYQPRVGTVSASATSAATSIAVTTGEGSYYKPFDVVRVMETGEGLLVTGVTTDTLGVTRTWGGTAAASATSAACLMIVGNAHAQGAGSGVAHVVKRVAAYNYTGIQRDSFSFSGTETEIELYGGQEPGKELIKKAVEHKRGIENTLFWGARDFDSSASPGPRGSVGGAYEYISTNVTNASGSLSPDEFDTFLQGPLAYGSKTSKVFFCAPTVGRVLSQMLRNQWAPATVSERKYGAKVDAFVNGAYGWEIPIIVKREWADLNATSTNFGTFGFLIDMDYVRMRTLRNRDTHIRRNIQEPSADAETHEYMTEFSLEFAQEKAHGILKGVTSYTAA
jgi:hypothetical protein